ncbi:MAG TPA: ABC transporter permease [Woeseiaceae bacterium]|nr:ABC transporter permease [Woeseiaceae bacterium]
MWQMMRGLLRRPVYAGAVTLVLGIGLGGAWCLYGVVDSVLFRPLAVADAGRLVRIFSTNEQRTKRDNWSRMEVIEQLRPAEAFESVAFYGDFARLTYTEGERQHDWRGAIVSGNFFSTLGVNPLAGRLLTPEDAERGAAPVAVLSAETWRNRFDADESVIGEAIRISGRLVTVVGVAPPGFSGVSLESRFDVWLPMSLADLALPGFSLDLLYGEQVGWLDAVARLAPAFTAAEAQRRLDTLRLARSEAETELEPALVLPAREVAVDPEGTSGARTTSWVLLGLVGVLLLVVWSDTVGLMLVRAETQRAETAVRMSLGATRGRIALETLAESALLAAAGAAVAALTAFPVAQWLVGSAGDDLGIAVDAASLLFNSRVLAAVAVMLALTVVLTSLAPMRRLARTMLSVVLRNAKTDGAGHGIGVRDVLVAVQVGVSLVLLTAAIVFAGSLRETLAIDPGFSVENRAAARIRLNNAGDDKQVYRRILAGLRNDPRVKHAALTMFAPVQSSGMQTSVSPQGYTPAPGESLQVDLLPVSDGFFATLGIELLAGRDVKDEDTGTPRRVVVNQAFVDRFWPGRSAVGLHIDELIGDGPAEVVGVAPNYRQRGLREPPRPTVYAAQASLFVSGLEAVVEATSGEMALAALREVTQREAPNANLIEPGTLASRLDELTARDRAITTVAAVSAAFATLLSIVGIYGIAAFSVRHRQREIGIRYSLGATRVNVVLRFLRRGALVASGGIALGALGALLLGPRFAATMTGVDGRPLPELLLVAVLLAAIAILANVVPVWRAANVAPMQVLRDE